ncbi:PEP-CTERM sorting domain-containing protein [Massilia antarctica]|uniref:PEP-CTERM sorting domain-containing protein n=1 Tax=Massilia antarctica TaxID=2765360 RepID=UPI0006BB8A0F|nr:PEP-CTERM sorting domain-containing protein [Massilia sp. H27-R4]MCY0912944.1 PEP-CTERM sorting domain-containing protein [Massilia sp. H27-R4]CUI07521.1 hypothetical protein BN2497_9819 [Janthinobacterium sp. CG23_2]CUU31307.1 hypothetical protein BN3177_9819 [Janthinobacterium sp. CG23_2]
MKQFTWTRSLAALVLAPGLAGAAPALIESPALSNLSKRYAQHAGIELADNRGAGAFSLGDVTRAMHMRPGEAALPAEIDLSGAIGAYANGTVPAWGGSGARHGFADVRASYAKQAGSGFSATGARPSVASQSVPEPETYVMLAAGVAVIVFTRGTRKRLQDSLDA